MSGLALVAFTAAAAASIPGSARRADAAPHLALERGDRICLLGNALAERMLHGGHFEARLHARFPEHELALRNLGFAADTLTVRQRTAGFGTPDEHLARCGASVVLAFFGYVESFEGDAGLPAFRRDLLDFVDRTLAQRYDGARAPRLVLVSSIPCEDLGDPLLPDPAAENRRIAAYNRVLADVAREKRLPYADVFTPLSAAYATERAPLTIDGIHLNERGEAALAAALDAALFPRGAALDPARVAGLRRVALEKAPLWHNRYHATDGYNVYGDRSLLAYEGGVTNREVLQRELEVLDAECANLDRRMWALARGVAPESIPAVPVPPLIPVVTNRPGDGPEGAHAFLSGDKAVTRMTPGPGLDVNLFASEERFPDLANPVQMSWDTRGRLWVAAWRTYPHWKPDEPRDDKLLVLEDVDGDGRADTCTAFAADLHNPTGFEFWNGGVVVANAPDLLFLEDADADGVADRRERILHGLSSADTHHSANSFVLGPDGALYFQEGIFHRSQIESVHGPVRQHDGCVWRFEPRTRRVERYAPYGFLNPHGHVFDRWGQDFVTDGTTNENFHALPISVRVDAPGQHPRYFPFFEQRSRPAGGTEILSSAHFPDDMQGDYLIANVIGFQGIFRYRVADDGSGFSAVERDPIVHSSDPNFRPVDLEVGPDGALYFLDWHNPLIGHMQHHLRDPSRDQKHGRIYRVTCRGRDRVKPAPIAGRPVAELLDLLKSRDDRVRYRARIELSGRPTGQVVAAATAWVAGLDARDPDVEHHRLEALWLQQQHAVLDRALLERVLASPEPRARAAAVRVLRHMRRDAADLLGPLARAVEDEHPRVRLEAVVALSFVEDARAAELALRVLSRPMDRFLTYALDATMRALEAEWRAALAAGRPFAADDAAALAYVLERSETDVITALPPSEAVHLEWLRRHGMEADQYADAARSLARLHGTSARAELLSAVERADARDHGHVDHLLAGLFQALARVANGSEAPLAADLARLAGAGRRATTRRLATAARIDLLGAVDASPANGGGVAPALLDVLDAAPFLKSAPARESVFSLCIALLEQPLPAASEPARGRYVRVELPGARRTLTLAEVEVLHGGINVAQGGRATQSTTNWGGNAGRALDGNTSGTWADGGQTHTIEDRPDPWWEVDLGSERPIDAVRIWNRADEAFGRRLEGAVVRVLDEGRRSVFTRAAGGSGRTITVEVPPAHVQLRRSAAAALAALGLRPGEAVSALAPLFADETLRSAAVEALLGIPVGQWPAGALAALSRSMRDLLAERSTDAFDSPESRALLALADQILERRQELGPELARQLGALRRGVGTQVVVIRTVPDSLLYDRREITLVAGRRVDLVFENVDIMPHNLVLTAPGALARVGMAAERMAASPDAASKAYVPQMPEVLQASRMLQPGETQTLSFRAPSEPGDYPYVCTFPGHWIRMNGVAHVVAEAPEDDPGPGATETVGSGRAFVRNWTVDELRPRLRSVDERLVADGRRVFDAASCIRCHQIGGEGGTTGPDLREVVTRYTPEELLLHVLEPSRSIAPEYVAEVFLTKDGIMVAGRVLAQDARTVRVQTDPYGGAVEELAIDDIEERAASTVSIMPSGLLSTFQEAEILALVAWLARLR